MRLLLTTIVIALFPLRGHSQISTVVSGEYFFDTDPGVGAATAIPPFAGSQNIDVTFLATSAGLSVGMHTLGIRVRDNNNAWSIPVYLPHYIFANNPSITGAEYFFDTDPGSGNATSIPVSAGAVIDVTFAANSSSLQVGMHVLGVRTLNQAGNWSMPSYVPFYIDQSRTITKLEYFFDTDPGSGNGIIVPVSPPTDLLDQVIPMNSNALAIGTHTVNVRAAGQNNFWSIPETATFSIAASAPPTISSFTPASGPIGTTVTITGTNFDTTPTNNIVYFGAVRASVAAATATQLTVTVPTGATFIPITVSVNGLTAHAPRPFVVTFPGGGTISNCSFAPSINISTTSTTWNTATSDIDGDGKIDLLIPERAANQLSVFRNTSSVGAPSFSSIISFTGLTEPLSVATGDIDGDGKPEMAVVNYTGGQLSVYKNLSTPGSISFAARVTYAIPAFTHHVSIADIDGDGKQDLVVSASVQGLIILRNQGLPGVIDASTFAAGVTFATGANAYPFALGDLDSDGKLDAAVPNANTYTLSVLRNTSTPGTVSFAAPISLTTNTGTPSAGFGASYVSFGDVDGDSKLDLAAVSNTVFKISLFRNTSTPGSLTFDPRFDIATTDLMGVPAFSDLNGDGKIELVTDNGTLQILVFENTASNGVINASSFNTPLALSRSASYTPQLGDIDGDGRNDVVSMATNVQLFRNLVGAISPPTITSFSPSTGIVGSTVTITGTNFNTPFSSTVSFNGIGAIISSSTATTLTVTVPTGATTGLIQVTVGCNSVTSSSNFTVGLPASITITTQPADVSICAGQTATFTTAATGTTNITYQWQFSPGTGTYSDINNGGSFSGVTTATLSVNTTNSFGAGQYRCRINGDLATEVITNALTLSINNCNNNQPPVILSSTTSVIIEGVVTIDLVPLISDPDNNLNLQSLQLVNSVSQAGAFASISTSFELTLDYGGVLFSGNDFITISVCDLLNDCIEQELTIDVIGDIEIYTGISPNSDDQNEIFLIRYIDLLPDTQENKVTIYNRWGSKVFEVSNYNNTTNVFRGLNNNGGELPSGTYFYKIEFISGRKAENGYLTLKK